MTTMEDTELIPEILPVDARLAFSGPVDGLKDIITRAARVLPDKEIIPGTAHILLEVKPSRNGTEEFLRASATDGTITVSAVGGDMNVRMAGAALIPGEKFLRILRMAPSSTVSVQVIGNQALIRSGRAQWRIQLPPGDTLPAMPNVKELKQVKAPREKFLAALKSAERAASHAAARSSLMQVKVKAGSITGSDGTRVHRYTFASLDDPLEVAIPVNTCQELITLLESSNEEFLLVGSDGRHMVFVVDRDYIVSSAIIVDFPDIEPLLIRASMNVKDSLTVSVEELQGAIRRVRVNSDPDFSAIFLAISKEQGGDWGVVVRAQDRQGNSAHEFIDARWGGPKQMRDLCVNHKNLTGLLDSYPGSTITFNLGDDTQSVKSPLLVESETFTGLLQQMRSDYLN